MALYRAFQAFRPEKSKQALIPALPYDVMNSDEAKEQIIDESDPVKRLDVSILQDNLLSPILDIDDPKTNDRIDFIGGIRGLGELERRCKKDMKLAFAMYPTSIGDLMSIADANLIMPPKSTWFEPKLLSGIFIHHLS